MMKKHYSFIQPSYLRYKKGPDLNLTPKSNICNYVPGYGVTATTVIVKSKTD